MTNGSLRWEFINEIHGKQRNELAPGLILQRRIHSDYHYGPETSLEDQNTCHFILTDSHLMLFSSFPLPL